MSNSEVPHRIFSGVESQVGQGHMAEILKKYEVQLDKYDTSSWSSFALQCGAPQWCERWFINPMNTIVICVS